MELSTTAEKEDTMSATATTSSHSPFSSRATRAGAHRKRVAALREEMRSRRFLAAQRAHEREDLTDAYIDRHGKAQLDVSALLGYAQR